MNPDMIAITRRLLELASELIDDQTLQDDALDIPLTELGLDSLMALELAVYLEREFGIRLTEDELGRIANLRDILDIIERKRG